MTTLDLPKVEEPPVGLADKVYVGIRHQARPRARGATTVLVRQGGEEQELARRLRMGFDWSCSSNETLHLAYAILMDHLGWDPPPKEITRWSTALSTAFLQVAPYEGFELTSADIAAWLSTRMGA